MKPTHLTNIALAPATSRMYALEQLSQALTGRKPPQRPALRRLVSAIAKTVSVLARKGLRHRVGSPATPTPD